MDFKEFRYRWAREEFLVLERDPELHGRISAALTAPDKAGLGSADLDGLVAEAKAGLPTPRTRRRAALAVWEQLKDQAPPAHAAQAEDLIQRLEKDPWAVVFLKKLFKVLAARQNWAEFLESSYLREP